MHIEVIDQYSPHLHAVKALGRAHAQTLGFFPEGAFQDYAARRHILIALDAQDQCLGYLLYRETRGHAVIVHLCVAPSARGQGVARALLNLLCEETRHLRGIRADCRRDYEADQMWPRLRFHAMGERRGRAKDGSTLTIWWLDHGHPDLFSSLRAEQLEAKLVVAIDANIFFDLVDSSRPHSEEAQALRADWLQADVELAVSDELWNEIYRNPDEAQRRRSRSEAERMTRFSSLREAFDQAYQKLRPLFPSQLSRSDESDLRQVAHAVAGHMRFFITRDGDILERADDIYDLAGLAVLRPSDLVVHLDSLRREEAYQPARLAGTLLETRLIQSREQLHLVGSFHAEPHEERRDFERRLRRHLSTPQTSRCLVALDEDQSPLMLSVYDESQADVLLVELFRVRKSTLRPTLIRYGLQAAVVRAVNTGRQVVRLSEPYVDDELTQALNDDGFFRDQTSWVKLVPAIAASASGLRSQLHHIATVDSTLEVYIQRLLQAPGEGEVLSRATAGELERVLWPAKILDAPLPTFLIPIRPVWAQELFDSKLSEQTLFGPLKALTLNREGVYYRSHRSAGLSAPGRILWYVSKDKTGQSQGTSAIRACSRLEEVAIGTPKELYRQFRRLGIYEWQHILKTAKGRLDHPVMAVRFRDTELFAEPVHLRDIQAIYAAYNKKPVLQSPSRITEPEIFAEIYRRGTGRGVGSPIRDT